MSFFQGPTEFPCSQITSKVSGVERLHHRVQNGALKSVLPAQRKLRSKCSRVDNGCDYVALGVEQEAHWEVVERILFVYAKLNPGQGYVQGMNEILGPVYYVFATDPDPDFRGELSSIIC
jgi:hypothetical protein